MSAIATATETTRLVQITEDVNALYQLETGKIEFRQLNKSGDFILASSYWNAEPMMTDQEVQAFYSERESTISIDFEESLAMRF